MSEKYPSVEEKVSYGVGQQMAEQLMQSAFEGMSTKVVLEGITDTLDGKEPALSDDELHVAYTEIAKRVQDKKDAEHKVVAQEGVDFLTANAEREEVTVLASGLQYEVIAEGSGEIPGEESVVRTHYRGSLIDGTLFDSSYERGQPTEFPVKGVIPGWIEALQLMPVGSKWKLFIPYQLAYGEQGAGSAIGPYQTLVFEIELIDIVQAS